MIIILCTVSYVHAYSNYPQTSGKSAVLIDGSSYRVLWGKNIDGNVANGEYNQKMTALVAIENGRLDDIVVIPKAAQGVEGSSIILKRRATNS